MEELHADDGRSRGGGNLAVVERALKIALGTATVIAIAAVVFAGLNVWDASAMGLMVVAALAPMAVTDGGASLLDLEVDVERGQGGTHRVQPRSPSRITPLGVLVFVSIPLALLASLIAR